MTATEPRAKTIQSVDRAASLIKAIADSPHSPTVNELATACGLNRSTTWRLLATLDGHGLIERDPISQRYSLGYAFLRIAAGADVDPLVRRGRPVLERLADDTGEATNLAVARRFSLVYVDQVDPPQRWDCGEQRFSLSPLVRRREYSDARAGKWTRARRQALSQFREALRPPLLAAPIRCRSDRQHGPPWRHQCFGRTIVIGGRPQARARRRIEVEEARKLPSKEQPGVQDA